MSNHKEDERVTWALKCNLVSEECVKETFEDACKLDRNERLYDIAYLKSKLADFDVYRELVAFIGLATTIITSNMNKILTIVLAVIFLLVCFGIYFCVIKEKIRRMKTLLAIYEQSLEVKNNEL